MQLRSLHCVPFKEHYFTCLLKWAFALVWYLHRDVEMRNNPTCCKHVESSTMTNLHEMYFKESVALKDPGYFAVVTKLIFTQVFYMLHRHFL